MTKQVKLYTYVRNTPLDEADDLADTVAGAVQGVLSMVGQGWYREGDTNAPEPPPADEKGSYYVTLTVEG